MSLAGVKVGDMLVVVIGRSSWRRAATAVGRKYITAGRSKYEIATGQLHSNYSSGQAYTLAQWAREEALEAFRDAVRKLDARPSEAVSAEELREAAAQIEALAGRLAR